MIFKAEPKTLPTPSMVFEVYVCEKKRIFLFNEFSKLSAVTIDNSHYPREHTLDLIFLLQIHYD